MTNATTQFHFMTVESEEMKKEIYRLRYQVYVEECAFESPEDHPEGLETDAYESSSLHLGAYDDTGKLAGACRIVLPSAQGLPIEHATALYDEKGGPPQETTAEISRMVVSRAYRRRIEDGLYGLETYRQIPLEQQFSLESITNQNINHLEKRRRPVIILGLFCLIYRLSKEIGITHLYMITEKRLWYMLQRYHLPFFQVGSPVEYHGIRIPYLASIKEIEAQLQRKNPLFFRMLMETLEHSNSSVLHS